MAEKPILFSSPMVRALLDGRKTQTRRTLKLPTRTATGGPIYENPKMGGWEPTVVGGGSTRLRDGTPCPEKVAIWHRTTGVCMATPIQKGDTLWVRETWADAGPGTTLYRADPMYDGMGPGDVSWKWRPSIFMPRDRSRLTLTVTDVRVQRLQEISEEDAIAEGVPLDYGEHIHGPGGYRDIWESINGPGSWEANPWVAAYTFEVAS